MEKIAVKIGEGLSSMADLILNTASWGILGEVDLPECLK